MKNREYENKKGLSTWDLGRGVFDFIFKGILIQGEGFIALLFHENGFFNLPSKVYILWNSHIFFEEESECKFRYQTFAAPPPPLHYRD